MFKIVHRSGYLTPIVADSVALGVSVALKGSLSFANSIAGRKMLVS